jgi:iron(II)-dependent oxidoreductase
MAGVNVSHAQRVADHGGPPGCRACHASEEIALPARQFETCKECHSESVPLPDNVVVAAAAGEAATAAAREPTRNERGPGMSVTMYYDETRIGADPNAMIQIPAGEFTMGTNVRLSDEGPEHRVTLPAFQIDKYEVTNLQYKQFIDATRHKSPQHWTNRTYPPGKIDHPVVYVSWDDAKSYCEWAGKRLPTDEEWEKAARGSDGRFFPYGNEFDMNKSNNPVRWTSLHQEGDTAPVGAFEAGQSPYGLYDTSGNVWEWTASWYRAYPGNTRVSENYGETYKTLKGGSWWDCSFYQCGISAPSYNRAFFLRGTRNKSFGLRCAKDADQQDAKH